LSTSEGSAEDLAQTREIVLDELRGLQVQVFLFGSYATGKVWRGSDIDVGVLPVEPLPLGLLTELRERLENSTILPKVDVVNLREVDPDFRERVLRHGIPWMR
jgi:predicted nucleotidyltransferase